MEKQYSRETIYSISGNRVEESIREFKQLDENARSRISVLKGHMSFGLHTYLPGPSTYITFLRDPVDRVISLYYFVLRTPQHFAHEAVTRATMSLEDFVTSGVMRQTDNDQTRLLSGVGAEAGFGDCTRQMLSKAQENLRTFFDVVGLVERFDETLILLKRTFGWGWPFYVRRNVTKSRPYRKVPPSRVIDLISQRNHLDLELYQYARKIMQKQLQQVSGTFDREVQIFQFCNSLYLPYGKAEAYVRTKYRRFKGS